MRKTLMPPIASASAVKAVLVSVQGSLVLTFAVWSTSALLPVAKGKPADWSLTIVDILLGNALLPVCFYERWAWRSKHRHAHWHRWLGRVIVHAYLSFLLVLLGVSSWNTIFSAPWNIVLSGITISLFLLAILLPFISYNLAKQLYAKQEMFDLMLLKFGGPASVMAMAGILGALIGLRGENLHVWVIALLASTIGVALAQYSMADLWPYRPWAKEDE